MIKIKNEKAQEEKSKILVAMPKKAQEEKSKILVAMPKKAQEEIVGFSMIIVIVAVIIIILIGFYAYNKYNQSKEIQQMNKAEFSFLKCVSNCPIIHSVNKSSIKGRLLLQISVKIPTLLSEEQREFLEKSKP
jgi:hypothetical protein